MAATLVCDQFRPLIVRKHTGDTSIVDVLGECAVRAGEKVTALSKVRPHLYGVDGPGRNGRSARLWRSYQV